MIETHGLTKRYGETIAVDDLDLHDPPRRGVRPARPERRRQDDDDPDAARADRADVRARPGSTASIPTRDPLRVKSPVGYLPDDVGFYDDLTARQNLRYTAELNRLPRRLADERDRRAARRRRAGRRRRPQGRRATRAACASGSASPTRWSRTRRSSILDEPTVNIDPEGVRELLLLVERLRTDQGVTVLLSSHLLHQVEQVCDRIGIFVDGQAASPSGTIDELAADLDDRWAFTVGVTGARRRRARCSPACPGVATRRPARGSLDRAPPTATSATTLQRRVIAAGGRLHPPQPRRRRPRRDLPPLLRRRGRAADDRRPSSGARRSTPATTRPPPIGHAGSAAAGASSPARSSPTTSARSRFVILLVLRVARRAGRRALGERADPRRRRLGDADAVDLPLPVHAVAGARAGVPRVPRHPRPAARHRLRLRRDQRRARPGHAAAARRPADPPRRDHQRQVRRRHRRHRPRRWPA